MSDDPREDIDRQELQRRVIYALLKPAVELADSSGLSLAELASLVQMAFFEALRSRGLKLREVADQMDVSERTAKRLAKEHRTNFAHGRAYALPVRIEFMLWAAPMSRAKLKQVLGKVSADEVDAAVETLLGEGRIVERPGHTTTQLEVNRDVDELVRDTWLSRIGGLGSFLSNLGDAVEGRFFEDDPHAFARTLSFLVRPQALEPSALQAFFSDQLVPFVLALDTQAKDAGDGRSMRLSVCWAPFSGGSDSHAPPDTPKDT